MFNNTRLSTTGLLCGVLAIASFVAPASLFGQEGAQVRVPAAEATPRQTPKTDFGSVLGSAGDERRISQRLTHRDRAVVADLGRRVRGGATFEDIRADWTALVGRAGVSSQEDVDELTRWVMREAYADGGESGELANIELQDSLQKQQQTLRLMSNMQKAKHDAAMNSIRNMK